MSVPETQSQPQSQPPQQEQPDRVAWRERVLPPVQKLDGGVWSIPVPIPDNPLRYTLVHLLESDRGPVLVDTGWDDPSGRELLRAGVAEAGFALEDVHGVLITHHHPDHHGLSAHVRATSGAWVGMHAAEAAVVRAVREVPAERWADRVARTMRGAGLPEEHLAELRTWGGDAKSGPTKLGAVVPDRELVHGESAGVPGRDLRVMWTPGHTPGHVCLFLDEKPRTRLLSGDHLLPTITPLVSLYPENSHDEPTDPLGDFLDSLERIAALGPDEILPAHQYRFTDAPGRVRELLDHHAARLADLHAQLRGGPMTLWEAAQSMRWNRPWSELGFFARHLAVSEAAAHLRRLVKTGLAEEVTDDEPVMYHAR